MKRAVIQPELGRRFGNERLSGGMEFDFQFRARLTRLSVNWRKREAVTTGEVQGLGPWRGAGQSPALPLP